MSAKETYRQILHLQYHSQILNAYAECIHVGESEVDGAELGKLIKKLERNAYFEGLPKQEFSALVSSALPGAEITPDGSIQIPAVPKLAKAA